MGPDDTQPTAKPVTMTELEKKFVLKELCGVKTDLIEKTEKSVKEIAKELAEFKLLSKGSFTKIMGTLDGTVKWQTQHQKLHDGWWKRSGIIAAIIATCISILTFAVTVFVVVTKLKP